MRRIPGLLAVLVVSLLSAPNAHPGTAAPVLLQVSPQVAESPGTFRATVTVQRHAANRRLVLSADSETYFRGSTIELEGENAPIRHVRIFDRLPAGIYEISAVLYRSDGSQIVDHVTGRVSGR